MSNYVQLCQRARREMGIAASTPATPSTVVGQTGILYDVVDWVQRAWIDIQASKPYWKFHRSKFTFNTTAGTRTYDPTQAPISNSNIDKWNEDSIFIYKTSDGVAAERRLEWRDYDWFTRNIAHNYSTAAPTRITEEPSRILGFDNIPDDIYTVTVNYWMTPEKLSNDGDIPALPEHFHDVIVWKAVMMYATRKQAPELYGTAKAAYDKMYFQLFVDQGELAPKVGAYPITPGDTRVDLGGFRKN